MMETYSWVRSEPCTVVGSGDNVPNAQWVYQKGWIKARADLQPEGLSEDDLVWVRLRVQDWDAPDAPLALPAPAAYAAAAAHELTDVGGVVAGLCEGVGVSGG